MTMDDDYGEVSSDTIRRNKNYNADGVEESDVWGYTEDPMADMQRVTKEAPFQVTPFSVGFADELFSFSAANDELSSEADTNTADSVRSTVTDNTANTVNSVSTFSTIPFPFYSRPTIPHVDEFIEVDMLRYANLRIVNFNERNAKLANKLAAPCLTQMLRDESKKVGSNYHPSSSVIRKKLIRKSSKLTSILSDEDDGITLTDKQIKLFVKYILSITEYSFEDLSSTNSISISYQNRMGVTFKDMKMALRMYTRNTSKFEDRRDYIQELLMASFDDLLYRSKITHSEWFNSNCMAVAGGDLKLTTALFNRGIREMCKTHDLPSWTNEDLKVLRLYMSLEGEMEPSLQGVLRAFKRFYATKEERELLEAALPIITKIKLLMKEKKFRTIDFFLLIEKDINQAVPPKKLMAAIKQLLVTATDNGTINGPNAYASSSSPSSPSTLMISNKGLYEDDATARTFDTTLVSTSEKTKSRPPKKLTSLEPPEPLSDKVLKRIETMHEDIQNRLSSSTYCFRAPGPDASIDDKLYSPTISVAMRSPTGKPFLTPIPGTTTPKIVTPKSLSNFEFESDFLKEEIRAISKKNSELSLNLSPAFKTVVKRRTQELVMSLKQYDKKRESNLNCLAAFF